VWKRIEKDRPRQDIKSDERKRRERVDFSSLDNRSTFQYQLVSFHISKGGSTWKAKYPTFLTDSESHVLLALSNISPVFDRLGPASRPRNLIQSGNFKEIHSLDRNGQLCQRISEAFSPFSDFEMRQILRLFEYLKASG
jgi:hypothetical protein